MLLFTQLETLCIRILVNLLIKYDRRTLQTCGMGVGGRCGRGCAVVQGTHGSLGLHGAQSPTAAFLPGVMVRLGWDVLRATHRGQENAARFDRRYLLQKCRHVHRQSLRKSYIPIKHSAKGWSWLPSALVQWE